MSWLSQRLQKYLLRSSARLNEQDLDSVEEILLSADMGPSTVFPMIERLREVAPRGISFEELIQFLKKELQLLFHDKREGLAENSQGLTILFVVGVNGTGKTTTLAKIAHYLKQHNKKVVLASCDTFRAAAADQLKVWADRLEVDLIQQGMGADPAAVAFDAIKAAQSRKADYLLCDTAGRLHNKAPLMEELKKIRKVVGKELPGAPHEVLLVLDATTGQNGFAQAKRFQEEMDVTGVVVSKLDGTAKAGVVVAIERDLKIPIKFIGVGESVSDFLPFSPKDYIHELLQMDS